MLWYHWVIIVLSILVIVISAIVIALIIIINSMRAFYNEVLDKYRGVRI